MPVPTTTPNGLRPFESHGLDLTLTPSGEAVGDCPFCNEPKFSVRAETGEWRCFQCESLGNRGNALTFLRKLHEASHTGQDDYSELVQAKGLLYPETLFKWGVCRSVSTGEWLIPAYNGDGNICQLYRYVLNPVRQKMVFWPTPKLHADEHDIVQGLFGANLFDLNKPDVHLCEGPWDGMAEWELLGGKINVLATPGVGVFFDSWVPRYFKGRRVSILFDNDHPKVNKETGDVAESRGYSGTKRTSGILKGVASSNRPESIRYLKWGDDGFDPSLPDGYDIRDSLTSTKSKTDREDRLKQLFTRLEAVPDSWPAVKLGSEELTPLPCRDWLSLLSAWEKAMLMTPGLRKGLAVLMASAISTELIGEQLWVRLMGPPSCGKTTLCEAMTVARKYVKAVSVFRGFHSGYKTDKDGEEDHSLIPHIMGRTFIIKDGDTLLKAPNREQIMSELRDVFDGTSRAHYRHGLLREYDNIRVTIIVSGTSNLRELDASECGGRFIDCIVMEGIDIKTEKSTLFFMLDKVWKNGKSEVNGKVEKRDDSDKIKAKRLTGGYIIYLRENAGRLAKKVETPRDHNQAIYDLGVFVAYMRARPSDTQQEISEREFGGRLAIQYARLALCLGAVLNKSIIDKETMDLVRSVALDTCRGRTLDITRFLYNAGMEGVPFASVLTSRGGKEDDLKEYMRFLKEVEIAETFDLRSSPYMQGSLRWRLKPHVRELYSRVVKGTNIDL